MGVGTATGVFSFSDFSSMISNKGVEGVLVWRLGGGVVARDVQSIIRMRIINVKIALRGNALNEEQRPED